MGSNFTNASCLNSSNQTGLEEKDVCTEEFKTIAVVVPEVVAILCSILGTAGNVLTVFTILVSPKLKRNPSYIFICNLSISDAIFCVFALPLQAVIYHNRAWMWSEQFCKWLASLKYAIFGTALMTLCAIALNRFISVVHPLQKQMLYTMPKIVAMLLVCWLLPAFISLLAVMNIWGEFAFQPCALSCSFGQHIDPNTKSHRIIVFATGLFIPILFMSFCYTRVCMVVYQSQKKIEHWSRHGSGGPNDQDGNRTSSSNSGLQLTRSMIIIFAVFTLGIAPYYLLAMFDPGITCQNCYLLLPMLSWIQVSLNPLIYTLTNSQFKAAYKRLLLTMTVHLPSPWNRSDTAVGSKEETVEVQT